jgi:DNA-binding MarR family transcriptional regulator
VARTIRTIWAINKAGLMFFARRLEAFGLGAGQYPLLSVLFAREGLSQEELASYLGIDKGAVAKSVRKLMDEGFVERREDEADGRVKRVWLSAKAKKGKKALLSIEAEWRARLLSGFADREVEELEAYLERIKSNAES